jgi:hypothetical protein
LPNNPGRERICPPLSSLASLLAGTAAQGTDYTGVGGATGAITFAASSATAAVTVDPTADTSVESDETVALTLAAGTGYTIGTTAAAVGTITNDDAPTTPAPSAPPQSNTSTLPQTSTTTAFALLGSSSSPSDITALPGYGVATSALFNFSGGGWAGWSVPDGKVVLGAKIISAGDSIDDFSVYKAAGPDEVYPHWTYGPAEYGWVMEAKQANHGVQIEVYYADPTTINVQVSPANVAEDGPDKLTYTFTATGPLTRDVTVNYSVVHPGSSWVEP